MSATQAPTYDHMKFRQVMGHFPTGVVVVAAATSDGKAALTLQSFQSLSLNPALILISVAKTSTSWPGIRRHGSFAVTFLADHHGGLARQFSRSDGGNKFEDVHLSATPLHGHPVLTEGSAWVECEIAEVFEGGDHDIVIARVTDLELLERAANPLVFFGSQFAALR